MAFAELALFAVLALALSMYLTGEANPYYAIGGIIVGLVFASLSKNEQSVLFETIPVENVRAAITNSSIAFLNERPQVKSFLRSFFPVQTADTKYISLEVRRGTEKLAADVTRGTGSNWNQVTKSTMKTILPTYWNEAFNVNDLEIYDVAYASMTQSTMRQLAQDMADEQGKIIDKIKRSQEKQCADVMLTGVITPKSQEQIDFRRKAASIVDDSAQYWNDDTVDPDTAFINAGKFLREQGKIQSGPGSRYVAILGGKAFQDLINNPIFQAKHDRKHINLGDILPATMNTDGASYHGYISVDSYTYDLWVYPEVYDNDQGVSTRYIDDLTLIVTSYTPDFDFTYGMVPQLPGFVVPMTIEQGFYMMEYMDLQNMNHVSKIMCAGIARPKMVDQVYTQKVTSA